VLVFPGQSLSDEAQTAFSRRFGLLEKLIADDLGSNPEFGLLSNLKSDGTLHPHESEHGLFLKGNRAWHTDSSFKRVPAMASILSARQVPDTGGGTEFADMRAAYDELGPKMQALLADKAAVHSYIYSQGLVGGLSVLSEEEQAALPPVEHPVIRVHPRTGRKNLYIGRHASHILDEGMEESRALLQQLCDDACQQPRLMCHYWQAGDIVIWDNRCVLHKGQTWPGDQARVMARTTIAGEDAGNEWSL
jgi:alpha-ketoglutarate-dependent 2,4-dichlorophenoxyacetate dioxygenase